MPTFKTSYPILVLTVSRKAYHNRSFAKSWCGQVHACLNRFILFSLWSPGIPPMMECSWRESVELRSDMEIRFWWKMICRKKISIVFISWRVCSKQNVSTFSNCRTLHFITSIRSPRPGCSHIHSSFRSPAISGRWVQCLSTGGLWCCVGFYSFEKETFGYKNLSQILIEMGRWHWMEGWAH